MKPVLLALSLALLGCMAGLALAADSSRPVKQQRAAKKAPDTKPAPRDATIYHREDVSLEEMQRYDY
ncbi:MAG TPA: hypothetical protein VHL85_10060 [Burkholderiales bacterium]|jgi:hypothetical protein|nr:hypothetical protein [Burkholderiales bacterium]